MKDPDKKKLGAKPEYKIRTARKPVYPPEYYEPR